MKRILLILILSICSRAYSQSIPNTITTHSKVESGIIGSEKFNFSLSDSYITITDISENSTTKYGPLFLSESAYDDEGLYFTLFKPDIKSDPISFARGKELIGYRFLYDRKGGTILFIDEMRIQNRQVKIKTYFTSEGYSKVLNSSSTKSSQSLRENNFNIEDVILNSTSLSQIMAKINFSFEQSGEKKTSKDGKFVTVKYKNNSLINPLVTYTEQGEVTQIVFLTPISNTNSIGKELVKRNGSKIINGTEVIQKGNLTYDLRNQNDVGYIVIY